LVDIGTKSLKVIKMIQVQKIVIENKDKEGKYIFKNLEASITYHKKTGKLLIKIHKHQIDDCTMISGERNV
jgi:hypothetical protein